MNAATLRANFIFERQVLGNTFQYIAVNGLPQSNPVDYLGSL